MGDRFTLTEATALLSGWLVRDGIADRYPEEALRTAAFRCGLYNAQDPLDTADEEESPDHPFILREISEAYHTLTPTYDRLHARCPAAGARCLADEVSQARTRLRFSPVVMREAFRQLLDGQLWMRQE